MSLVGYRNTYCIGIRIYASIYRGVEIEYLDRCMYSLFRFIEVDV